MSAVESIKPVSMPKLLPGQAFLSGLISHRRRFTGQQGTVWLTVLKLPSADEFSNPGTVELRSRSPLGEVNDRWSGVVLVTGYARSFNSKADPDTGEIKAVRTAQNVLEAVEV